VFAPRAAAHRACCGVWHEDSAPRRGGP
jgi:hypothetical protein